MDIYKHILFATDFSTANHHVMKKVQEFSKHYNAKLSVIHVLQFYPGLSTGMLFAAPANMTAEQLLLSQSKEHLQKWAEEFGIDKNNVYVEQGSPKRVIRQFAIDKKADLIVVGAHSQQGLDVLLGSTASAILNQAPCDVLVMKTNQS